jgi:DNA mismatch endonuclease, patch repair protein
MPAANRKYWQRKLHSNRSRDARNLNTLREAGWSVLVVWECQISDQEWLTARLNAFLVE